MVEPGREALPQTWSPLDVYREFLACETFFYKLKEQQVDLASRANGVVVERGLGAGRAGAWDGFHVSQLST